MGTRVFVQIQQTTPALPTSVVCSRARGRSRDARPGSNFVACCLLPAPAPVPVDCTCSQPPVAWSNCQGTPDSPGSLCSILRQAQSTAWDLCRRSRSGPACAAGAPCCGRRAPCDELRKPNSAARVLADDDMVKKRAAHGRKTSAQGGS